jgi:hypothetical protein
LTSSLEVTATSMAASSAPACASTEGSEAWPTTVRMSSFSASSRSRWWSVSTTVMSLRSLASAAATEEPTWPAPRIRIFISPRGGLRRANHTRAAFAAPAASVVSSSGSMPWRAISTRARSA